MRADEFWDHVDKTGDCWLWMGRWANADGRGRVQFEGRAQYAYRVAWQLTNGEPIPADMQACHRCDNPRCVRPSHIFVGTAADNMRDAAQKGRLVGALNPRRGVEHHAVTVTPELVTAAVEEYLATRVTQAEIAAKYGVSQSCVSNWLHGKTRSDSGLPPRSALRPCGTRAAYERHRRRGEKPCAECVAAERQDQRERRARRGAQAARWSA